MLQRLRILPFSRFVRCFRQTVPQMETVHENEFATKQTLSKEELEKQK